jgi:hypothetical protein
MFTMAWTWAGALPAVVVRPGIALPVASPGIALAVASPGLALASAGVSAPVVSVAGKLKPDKSPIRAPARRERWFRRPWYVFLPTRAAEGAE